MLPSIPSPIVKEMNDLLCFIKIFYLTAFALVTLALHILYCLVMNFFFSFLLIVCYSTNWRSQFSGSKRGPIYDVEQPLHSPQLILQERSKKEAPLPFLLHTASLFTVSGWTELHFCECATEFLRGKDFHVAWFGYYRNYIRYEILNCSWV